MPQNLTRTQEALTDMLESALKALQYASQSGANWRADEMKLDAIIRRLELVGEAARRVPVPERDRFYQIDWKEIVGFRSFLIHEYDKVELEIVSEVLKDDLPVLIAQLMEILAEERTL